MLIEKLKGENKILKSRASQLEQKEKTIESLQSVNANMFKQMTKTNETSEELKQSLQS